MLIRHINLSMKVKELFELTDQRKLDRRGAVEKSELIMLLEASDRPLKCISMKICQDANRQNLYFGSGAQRRH